MKKRIANKVSEILLLRRLPSTGGGKHVHWLEDSLWGDEVARLCCEKAAIQFSLRPGAKVH